MMYLIKLIQSSGSWYWAQSPFTSEAPARAAFAQQLIPGRFVRAELWSGTLNGSVWTDTALLDSKSR